MKFFYLILKGLYLLFMATVLPVAVSYLIGQNLQPTNPYLNFISGTVLTLGLFFIVMTWTIFTIALSMYFYPGTLGGAIALTAGIAANLFFSGSFSGKGFVYGCYISFVASLIALLLFFMLLFIYILFKGSAQKPNTKIIAVFPWWGYGIACIVIAFYAIFVYIVSLPVLHDWYMLAANTGRSIALAGFVAQIIMHVQAWYLEIIKDRDAPNQEAVDNEWGRWAAPTTIVLILSITAAILAASSLQQ